MNNGVVRAKHGNAAPAGPGHFPFVNYHRRGVLDHLTATEFRVQLGIGYGSSLIAAKRGDVIVAIDVLRCSSTIVTALANGAKAVIPVKSVREARSLSRRRGAILAGERNGLRPAGFELGNSPLEYRQEKVQGRVIVLTTTSGTKAIVLGRKAREVLVGSFLNLSATANHAGKTARSSRCGISLVTAGTRGRFSLEDFLCAGALSRSLAKEGASLDDGCISAARAYGDSRSDLHSAMREGVHAKYLESIGLGGDVGYCAQTDIYDIAAVYRSGRIVIVKPSDS